MGVFRHKFTKPHYLCFSKHTKEEMLEQVGLWNCLDNFA